MAPQMTLGHKTKPIEKPKQKSYYEDGMKRYVCNRCTTGNHFYKECKSREYEWADHSSDDAEKLEADHRKRYEKTLFNDFIDAETGVKFVTHRRGTKPSANTPAVEASGPQAAKVDNPSTPIPVAHSEAHEPPRQPADPSDVKAARALSETCTTQAVSSEAGGKSSIEVSSSISDASPAVGTTASQPQTAPTLNTSQQGFSSTPENKDGSAVQDVAKYPKFSKLTDATYPPRAAPGTRGLTTLIRTNFLRIQSLPTALYRYSISYALLRGREVKNKRVKIDMITQLLTQPPFAAVRRHLSTDWSNLLISTQPIYSPQIENTELEQSYFVRFTNQSQPTAPQQHEVKVKPLRSQQPSEFENYVNRTRNTDCSEVITALNILAQDSLANPASQYVRVGRGTYFEDLNATAERDRAWSDSLHPRSGFVVSVRPGDGRKLLNLNVASTAFHNRMLLTTLIRRHIPQLQSLLDANQTKDLRALVCGLRARLTYIPPDHTTNLNARGTLILPHQYETNGRSKCMNGLGSSSETQMFTHGLFGLISVREYFDDHVLPQGHALQYPNWPAINIGGTRNNEQVWIPPELLWLQPHQPFRGKLPSNLVAPMINFARKRPNDNADMIVTNGVRDLRVQHLANDFGLRFDLSGGALTRLMGRLLPPPVLQYQPPGGTSVNNSGQWNLSQKRFLTQSTLDTLHVIGVGPVTSDTLHNKCQTLATGFRTYGINVASQAAPPNVKMARAQDTSSTNLDRALLQLKSNLAMHKDPILILMVIPRHDARLYSDIKHWGDTYVGIPTVVCTEGKLRTLSGDFGFQANIALKVNIKLGGRNHALTAPDYNRIRNETMVVGADVTHPGPGSLRFCPSIAAVVASTDKDHTTYPGSVRLQTSRQEIIENLDEMIAERLRCWLEKNNRLPSSILFYRDGVSESQFAVVKNVELEKIKAGCRLVGSRPGYPDYEPKITLVTVTKRHQTRFYPLGKNPPEGWAGAQGNFKSGLVVDTVITSPFHFDFYLQSHGPRQGTARNGHYFVLENGMNLTPNELQGITYNLCWLYARSTTAVSYATPAYYADRLCDRARCWLRPMLVNRYERDIPTPDNNEAGVLRLAKANPTLWPAQHGRTNPWHPNLNNMMFYLETESSARSEGLAVCLCRT